jgi:hypothetical protein
MQFPRLPRFKRAPVIAPIELIERDREIIRHVHRHRFLRSSDITALVGGSRQQVLRRLQLLYHHRYLERPRCQLDYYYQGGSQKMVYGLGEKGVALLTAEGIAVVPVRQVEKDRSVCRVQLEHSLLVAEIMVAIELSCRKNGIKVTVGDQIVCSGAKPVFRWKVEIDGSTKLGILPDRVFAIDFTGNDGDANRAFFFLEADRGTMPVIRKDFALTSMYRKFLAYEATWSQDIHRTRFGFNRFRVLTVTTSAERQRSLLKACSELKGGHGLFLFADRSIVEKDIFDTVWQNGRGESVSLLQ